jgi:hypothetical protein
MIAKRMGNYIRDFRIRHGWIARLPRSSFAPDSSSSANKRATDPKIREQWEILARTWRTLTDERQKMFKLPVDSEKNPG